MRTPRESFKKAFEIKWLNNEKTWLQMLKDRKETSYTYDETKADEIFEHIKTYLPEMKSTFTTLEQHFENS